MLPFPSLRGLALVTSTNVRLAFYSEIEGEHSRFFGGISHAIPPLLFVNSPGANVLRRAFDAAVALASTKNDDMQHQTKKV